VITAAILSDGTVAMAYTLSGPEYPQYSPRTGVRLNNGEIVDFEVYGIQQTEETPELAAEPTEEAPFNPPPSETSIRTEDVARTEEVIREPDPQPAPVEPVAPTEPEITPEPTPEPEPILEEPEEPVEPLDPEVEESLEPEPVEPPTEPTEPEISPELPVQPETEPTQEFNSPLAAVGEAIAETFKAVSEAVGEVIEAFQTAGLDMTVEERKEAQSVVVPTVMVSQVAASSMIRK
jgi:hypothetical protein